MSEVSEDGPSLFMPLVVMENLVDKLKLLNYDAEFVNNNTSKKAINRHYFALQTNPGEQFFTFCSLSSFLIKRCNKQFDEPQESDDPNSVISNILDVSRQLGITVDFPPNKLKQGFGEHVLYILDRLADEALKSRNFTWKKPEYPVEEEEVLHVVDNDSELTLAKIEEDLLNYIEDDDDDEQILGIEDLAPRTTKPAIESGIRMDDILEGITDNSEWKLELERVMPNLRVRFQDNSKDWRNHIEQMQRYFEEIENCFPNTRSQLEKLSADVSRSLDKISSREKYINAQLESPVNAYRAAVENLEVIKNQYHRVNGGIVDRSRQLAEISEELDNVKQEIDEKSAAMTDGSPLLTIKKALARVKNEVVSMDVRIAVLEHFLLQNRLRDKSVMQRELSASLSQSPFMESVY